MTGHSGNRQTVQKTWPGMMDMDFAAFKALIAEIMSQGYDRETAGRYAGAPTASESLS